MSVELGEELGFLNHAASGRRGLFSNVAFLAGLDDRDRVMLGCRLQHVQLQHTVRSRRNDAGDAKKNDSDDAADQNWIMEEGERDDRMFIVAAGKVRLCRNKADGEESGVGGGPDVKLSLGKLGEGDYFGEALRGR